MPDIWLLPPAPGARSSVGSACAPRQEDRSAEAGDHFGDQDIRRDGCRAADRCPRGLRRQSSRSWPGLLPSAPDQHPCLGRPGLRRRPRGRQHREQCHIRPGAGPGCAEQGRAGGLGRRPRRHPDQAGSGPAEGVNDFAPYATGAGPLSAAAVVFGTGVAKFLSDQAGGLQPGWPAEAGQIEQDIHVLAAACGIPMTIPSGYTV